MNNPHTSSPVFDTVLSLLRSALWGESFQASPDTDWNAVNKELKQQAVMHLPVDILCKENPAQKNNLYQLCCQMSDALVQNYAVTARGLQSTA